MPCHVKSAKNSTVETLTLVSPPDLNGHIKDSKYTVETTSHCGHLSIMSLIHTDVFNNFFAISQAMIISLPPSTR